MDKKSLILLILILVLSAVLRLAYLTYVPPSLNWDEISHGYNAYSILKTGMDQWGERYPMLNFRAYGDYPTTLNLYLTIPFIAIMGLTEFAIRFPHAILGILTVLSVYFLTYGVTKKKNVSLLSAFLAATSPWYLFTSRFVLQSNLSVFLITSAAAFFVNRKSNKYNLFLSSVLFGLTLFSYHSTRIFSPILLIGVAFIYRDELNKKIHYLYIGLFLLLSVFIVFNPSARARSNVLFILDKGAIAKIEFMRNTVKLPAIFKKVIYNRPVYFVTEFTKKYISYFSPKFLFLEGGTQYQFSIPKKGLVFPIWLPFFYIGVFVVAQHVLRNKDYRMLFLWFVLAPIPASLTNESYTVIRATTMLPLTEIFISIGTWKIVERYFNKYAMFLIITLLAISLLFLNNYWNTYFTTYRSDYSWSWQYGYKDVVSYVEKHYSEYDKVIVTKKYGEPHEYFLFYLKYDPKSYITDQQKITYQASDWWWVDHFDKFWFVNDWDAQQLVTQQKIQIDCAKIKCLLITTEGNSPANWKRLEVVKFLDGKTAFEIFENE